MHSRSTSEFPGFDRLFALERPYGPNDFTADIELGGADAVAVVRGEVQTSDAHASWYCGRRKPRAIVGTTGFMCVLLAPAVIDALSARAFSGWSSFEVPLTGRDSEDLGAYHGLVVTGRCGPVQRDRSTVFELDAPGGPYLKERGLYFDEGSWDGSDLFIPAVGVTFIVTEEVVEAIGGVTRNVHFVRRTEYERPHSIPR